MAAAPLDDLFDAAFLDRLAGLPIEEIRGRLARATEVEVGLSYMRRLIQGRLDIVLDETRRRERGEQSGDLSALVERLPEILGEHLHGPGTGRLPRLMLPGDEDRRQIERLDLIVDAGELATLPELADTDLRVKLDALVSLEEEVSGDRRAVHDVIDRLQEELVRRYKTGEATVDSLLS
jgi:hypothetical protein